MKRKVTVETKRDVNRDEIQVTFTVREGQRWYDYTVSYVDKALALFKVQQFFLGLTDEEALALCRDRS